MSLTHNLVRHRVRREARGGEDAPPPPPPPPRPVPAPGKIAKFELNIRDEIIAPIVYDYLAKKVGRAPRSNIERQAQALLQELGKLKISKE